MIKLGEDACFLPAFFNEVVTVTNRERWEEVLQMLPDDVFGAVLVTGLLQNTLYTFVCEWCKKCGYPCSNDTDCPSLEEYLNSEVSAWQERQQ